MRLGIFILLPPIFRFSEPLIVDRSGCQPRDMRYHTQVFGISAGWSYIAGWREDEKT
jgi:hypothetical protein